MSFGASFKTGPSFGLGVGRPRPGRMPVIFNDFAGYGFSDRVTFSRDSTVNGWTLDANGDPVLTEFAIDQPAFVIDPATGQSLGYRSLAGFTNSLLWSRDLSNAVWSSVSDIALSRDSVGVDGTANTAWTATDTGTGFGRFQQDIAVSDDSNTHTVSVFIRKDSDETRFPAVAARARGGTTELNQVTQINTKTGALSDVQTDGSGSIEDGGSWWLITLTITNNGSGNTTLQIDVFPAHGDTFGSASGGATGSIVYDFGGVYLNSIAGPPIETEDAPESTATDDASEPTSSWFNPDEGTILVEVTADDVGISRSFWEFIKDGDANNRMNLTTKNNGDIRLVVVAGGTVEVDFDSGPMLVAGETSRIAVGYKQDDFVVYHKGQQVGSASSGNLPTGIDLFRIAQATGVDPGNLAVGQIKYFGTRRSNADLQAATS